MLITMTNSIIIVIVIIIIVIVSDQNDCNNGDNDTKLKHEVKYPPPTKGYVSQ